MTSLLVGALAPVGVAAMAQPRAPYTTGAHNIILPADGQQRVIAEPGWIAIAAQEKQPGWGEGYSAELRNGEWEYAAFDGAGARSAEYFTFHFRDYAQARPR